MQRREFFKLSAMAGAAFALTPLFVLDPVPVLYGDNIHDDTKAIQAWFDGERVRWADGTPVSNELRGGTFRLTNTLQVRECDKVVTSCRFEADMNSGKPMLRAHDTARIRMSDTTFSTGEVRMVTKQNGSLKIG